MAKKKDNGSKTPANVHAGAPPDLDNAAAPKLKPTGDEVIEISERPRGPFYEGELKRLQFELVRLQYWVKETGQRMVLIFEGRDAAGKGGALKSKPSDVERTQWYFQRYVRHLPAAGEIVIFDRSWYNRAGVEAVMGFCTEQEYWEFLRACPEFERLLVRSGIFLLKYWLSVSDDEQERRFQERAGNPAKQWKLSPMDLLSRERWVEYSKAKDRMMEYTDIPEAPWYQVIADDKRRAHLNLIHHLLAQFPAYTSMVPEPVKLTKRPQPDEKYVRPPHNAHAIIPDHYADYKGRKVQEP